MQISFSNAQNTKADEADLRKVADYFLEKDHPLEKY